MAMFIETEMIVRCESAWSAFRRSSVPRSPSALSPAQSFLLNSSIFRSWATMNGSTPRSIRRIRRARRTRRRKAGTIRGRSGIRFRSAVSSRESVSK